MVGRIHSVETFGTVDGPGIRYVVFMQGCPLRCLYCHNPDTWSMDGGREVSVAELLSEYDRNKDFYSKGGITVTGGEPLMQLPFLTELFRKAKEKGIHTCIDTSGAVFNPQNADLMRAFEELARYTDLVLLDIKHIDREKHIALTGMSNENILAFAKFLEEKKIPLWVRHTVVEGYTDNESDLVRLGEFIGSLKNLRALDVLPYHTMGAQKYKEMGMKYRLEGLPPLPQKKALEAKKSILEGIKKVRV